jgi:uncharacterized RDD family membrane protein YckC
MSQLVGSHCVVCREAVCSILDGEFCSECGNPIHLRCLETLPSSSTDRCLRCGGDKESSLAQAVKVERSESEQAERKRQVEEQKQIERQALPEISTHDTLRPRYIAACMDNFLAIVAGFVAAKLIAEDAPAIQTAALVGVYLGYFFLLEGLISRTVGKFATGLTVAQYDGKPCTWRQAAIRTIFRVVEVDPVLLGALPAALAILWSPNRQRWGDRFARTIVVPMQRVRDRRARRDSV